MSGIILALMWASGCCGAAQVARAPNPANAANAAGEGDAGVRVQVVTVAESRFRDFSKKSEASAKTGGEPFGVAFSSWGMGQENALTLTVELRGKPVAAATHYGKVRIARATTDAGASSAGAVASAKGDTHTSPTASLALTLAADYRVGLADPRTEFVMIDRDSMNFGQPEASADHITVEVRFDPPPRSATHIVELAGALELRTGQPREVVIEGVAAGTTRAVEDPTLAEAGLKVELVDSSQKSGYLLAGEPGKSVTLRVSGNVDALLDVDLVSAANEPLYASQMTSTSDAMTVIVLEDDAKLPPDARLRLSVAVGTSTVAVPFSFKDIPLP